MSSLKSVGKLLADDSGELYRLMQYAARLKRATDLLRSHLEPPLSQCCRVSNLVDNVLVVQVDSPAWAARLRFRVAGILTYFNGEAEFGNLDTIRIKVSPISLALPAATNSPAPLSAQAIEHIRAAAQAVTEPGIRAALLKLIERY